MEPSGELITIATSEWPEPYALQRRVFQTEDVSFEQLGSKSLETLQSICEQVGGFVSKELDACNSKGKPLTGFTMNIYNIRDAKFNPNGDKIFFRVMLTR